MRGGTLKNHRGVVAIIVNVILTASMSSSAWAGQINSNFNKPSTAKFSEKKHPKFKKVSYPNLRFTDMTLTNRVIFDGSKRRTHDTDYPTLQFNYYMKLDNGSHLDQAHVCALEVAHE